jgi:protein-tyrosine phosphatase
MKEGKATTINVQHEGRPVRILFVCLGNICRSPAAQGVMQALVDQQGEASLFEIDSAGTGRYHIGQQPDRRMVVHARYRGINLNHCCRQVCTDDFHNFDLIIGMDRANIDDLHAMAPDPESEKKIVAMGDFLSLAGGHYDYVPDPYYEGADGFELVLDLLQDGCQNLYNLICPNR